MQQHPHAPNNNCAPPMPQGAPGMAVAMGVPMGPPALYPNGIGITDRPQHDENDCGSSPCHCLCCARPIFYADSNRRAVSQMVEWRYGLCGFHVENADIFGTRLSFEGQQICCSCDQRVDVRENGQPIGHVMLYGKPCECSQTIMAEAFDARGVSKFARIDNPCNPYDHFSGDHCGWHEHNWPVVWTPNQAAGPIAHITQRQHCCIGCYPTWTGIRQLPQGAPPEDQKLLLAMIHGRFWRSEQQKQQKNNGHGGH